MDEGASASASSSAAPATLPDSGVTAEAASAAAGPSEGRRGLASEESPMRDMDLMSTEWTDEKHNLYLNSIEASFISQLYSSEYSLDDFHGLSPVTKKDNASASDINNRSTGQFKVQRDGSWGKINFERATNHVENKARLLTANPWIQRFRSPLIRREREMKSSEQNGSMDMAIMESGHGIHTEEFASSEHPIDTCSQIYYQASDGSTAEVTDQNFVDMNSKEQLNGSKKRRRTRTKVTAPEKPIPTQTTDNSFTRLEGEVAEFAKIIERGAASSQNSDFIRVRREDGAREMASAVLFHRSIVPNRPLRA